MNGEGELGGENVESGAALIVFELWEQSVACLALGVCPKENTVEDPVFCDVTTCGLELYHRLGGGGVNI
jgi:hypothetical protein